MLRSIKRLHSFSVVATDGPIGRIRDLLFSDVSFMVVHFVVHVRGFLSFKTVILDPEWVKTPDWCSNIIHVKRNKKFIKECPGLNYDPPLSKQMAERPVPFFIPGTSQCEAVFEPQIPSPRMDEFAPNHLRSSFEILGYAVKSKTTYIGSIYDIVVSDITWKVESLIIKTKRVGHNSPRQMLVKPDEIEAIKWDSATVFLTLRDSELDEAKYFTSFDDLCKEEIDKFKT